MLRPSLILLTVLGLSSGLFAQTTTAGPRVIPVYLVPRDMALSREGLTLTVKALETVRQWYGRVLQGRTFRYDPVVVQVSRHSFAEFAADGFQAWWPLLQSEFQAYGQDWDVARVCPDSGRTGTAWWCSWYTFMGTVAHELGHTWGLPHPDALLPGFRCADSTAWSNMQCHWGFPFDSLLPFERMHLSSLRHFQYRVDSAPFHLLSRRMDLGPGVTRFNPEGDSLLWVDGRGGGTGYLSGLVGSTLTLTALDGWFVADIGLPRGSRDSVSLRITVNNVERYQRRLISGDPPLPVSIPLTAGQVFRLEALGRVALGNARMVSRTTPR